MSTENRENFDSIRAVVRESGRDARVEVNQRALIDKILARYASSGAVYRELLQNSNDAEATDAEIHFTCAGPGSPEHTRSSKMIVQQVMYRNNGLPFRPEDWSRLQKIAEGNPDVSKIGAFGVGAYTMFSICEEPLIISGTSSLCFVWKGDALWCKTAPLPPSKSSKWTTFVLPSRDPYPLPDLAELGEFLCASLTFTKSLTTIRVLVNDILRLSISKSTVQEPRIISTPKGSTSWFWMASAGANTATPHGTFALKRIANQSAEHSIYESIQEIVVDVHPFEGQSSSSSISSRFISATAMTNISSEMARRMHRVTKKDPPKSVQIFIFLNAAHQMDQRAATPAEVITRSFTPKAGNGRVFIGFRTSQTTGLAAHVAAPFVPTVEREAMDLQDPTLRLFNMELLEMAGILLRLALEDSFFNHIDIAWKANRVAREALESKLLAEHQKKKKEHIPKVEESTIDDENASDNAGILMGFARFMARGVKKTITSVVSSVQTMTDDGSEYLNPADPRPLSKEEEDAIVLMQGFCPMQSTPDASIGLSLAQGFTRALEDSAPPVLSRSGVVRGTDARLPYYGIETFVKESVVRAVLYRNAEEYHNLIAGCPRISLADLVSSVRCRTIDEAELISLMTWLTKYNRRIDPGGVASVGLQLKEAINFFPDMSTKDLTMEQGAERQAVPLRSFSFCIEEGSPLCDPKLPMPKAVLPRKIQEKITPTVLADPILCQWFRPLTVELWTDFICRHPCMTSTTDLAIAILVVLSKHYINAPDRQGFGSFCARMLSEKPCIPFDSVKPDQVPIKCSMERPSELYVFSAQLDAFEGLGSFRKAASSLQAAGVAEDFLICLGVRKSIAIDFLFSNLESLSWNNDPKPLISYLQSATLTNDDWKKLSLSQYLPSKNDDARLFAPSELYLPSLELSCLPFLKMLRWPSEPEIRDTSPTGKFLVKIGMKKSPALSDIFEFISNAQLDNAVRIRIFDFLCDKLGPHGVYRDSFSSLSHSQRQAFRFLPCTLQHPFSSSASSQKFFSTVECFTDEPCGVFGFPVLDKSALGKNTKLYGNIFQCTSEPNAQLLIPQLLHLVKEAKRMLHEKKEASLSVVNQFGSIFRYLSRRVSDLDERALKSLEREAFIPRAVDDNCVWYRPDEVFFTSAREDSMTKELFILIDFCAFLAATGVKQEASTDDLFKLLVSVPQKVLNNIGEEKYRLLLRRIASKPPFERITPDIRNASFLLAYRSQKNAEPDSAESVTYHLSKACDIYVIDNSLLGRLFDVDRAPHESDLQELYVKLGATYISKSVSKRFEVVGEPRSDSVTVTTLRDRVAERKPLLVSPNITSRLLVKDAASVLSPKHLAIYEASNLMAVYTLNGVTRRDRTTCCLTRYTKGAENTIFLVEDFDWFDVGYAIGDLILSRCELQDAFLLSSILQAPLEQLRSRGFPVDRIIMEQQAAIPPPVPRPAAEPIARVNSSSKKVEADKGSPESGMEQILMQMFPDAAENFVRSALGSNPSIEDVRALAEKMSSASDYPKAAKPDHPVPAHPVTDPGSTPNPQPKPTHSKYSSSGFFNVVGRALSGIRGAKAPPKSTELTSAAASASSASSGQDGIVQQPVRHEISNPESPAADAQSQAGLEQMLERTVRESTNVQRQGFESGTTKVMSKIPDGLGRGETCELVPGHRLIPFAGPRGDGKTLNGLPVFASKENDSQFLTENEAAVEQFSIVLVRIAEVYGVKTSSVAIFYDPSGRVIAFNRNRALHFNLRYFYSLHFAPGKTKSIECYGYWYCTTAHELAHHLVSAHNKEHGFYTESYTSRYLPKFVALLSKL